MEATTQGVGFKVTFPRSFHSSITYEILLTLQMASCAWNPVVSDAVDTAGSGGYV